LNHPHRFGTHPNIAPSWTETDGALQDQSNLNTDLSNALAACFVVGVMPPRSAWLARSQPIPLADIPLAEIDRAPMRP
jgi:hypothetical protein